MKSFKDEITEGIDSFTKPVSQMFKNIGYSISDTISDAVADRQERGEKYKEPRKKGCLWPIIKWILILSVISASLSECTAESSISVENNTQDITQNTTVGQVAETQSTHEMQTVSDETESIENTYDWVLVSARNNIDALLTGSPVDMDALQSEYEFLLSLRISEYLFKALAYGYFTGDYETKHFNGIVEECNIIRQEMIRYFPEEEVEGYYTEFAKLSYRSFGESYFDYDSILIGSEKNPDVNAMWLNYVDSLVGNTGMDIRTAIAWHSMEMYAMQIPTEPTKTHETEATIPTHNDSSEKTHVVGYVVYGTGGLNIRTGPGVDNDIVGRLLEGEKVIIEETQYVGTTQWARINQGWISMDYVQFDMPALEVTDAPVSGEIFETDFFYITLPDNWDEKYVIEHSYSARSENLVFYYASEYEYYQGTYSEPGGWPFAIEVRADGTDCSAIAGWEHIGSINVFEDSWYELYLHYPMDPQFMDGSYNSFLADAQSIVDSIVAKDGYTITIS